MPEPPRNYIDLIMRKIIRDPTNLFEIIARADPDLAARLDRNTIQVLSNEFLEPSFRARVADCLFEVPYLADDGSTVLICVLLEHQSEEDPFLPVRALLYLALFWSERMRGFERDKIKKADRRLPPVAAVVLSTGKRG